MIDMETIMFVFVLGVISAPAILALFGRERK